MPNFRIPTSQSIIGPMGETLEHGAEDHLGDLEEREQVEGGGPSAGVGDSERLNRFEDVEEGSTTRRNSSARDAEEVRDLVSNYVTRADTILCDQGPGRSHPYRHSSRNVVHV